MPPATTAAQGPQPHEHDQIAITNIDMNCTHEETYSVERSVPVAPVGNEPNPLQIPRYESRQVTGSFNHKDFFEVRYNGTPFRLRPGETRVFPRYLAEHFAKHLADHVLGKKEQKTNRTGLIQSNVERPKVLAEIMQVQQWYLQDAVPQPGNAAVVDDPGVPSQDLGHVPAYHVGNLKAEPKTAEEILAAAGEVPQGNAPAAPATTGVATPADIANQKDPAQTPNTPNTDPNLPASNDIPNSPDFTQQPPNPTGPVAGLNIPPNPADTGTPAGGPDPGAVPGTNAIDGPSKADYIREAVQLGIEVNGRESVEELRGKIQAFATPH